MEKRKEGEDFFQFDAVESMLSEVLDSFDGEKIDFSTPIDVTFRVSLDQDGFLKVNEFGFMPTSVKLPKQEQKPMAEVIDLGQELLVVFDTANSKQGDVSVKLGDGTLVISSLSQRKVLRRVSLPCRVDPKTLRVSSNNGVLETRVTKSEKEQNAVLR